MRTGGRRVRAAHLILVFDDVGVDLVQRRHAVELAQVEAGLLGQVRAHVLVADGRHSGDVRVVPRAEVKKRKSGIQITRVQTVRKLIMLRNKKCGWK